MPYRLYFRYLKVINRLRKYAMLIFVFTQHESFVVLVIGKPIKLLCF